MTICVSTTTCVTDGCGWLGPNADAGSLEVDCHAARIAKVFDVGCNQIPRVDDATLTRYYTYLLENLLLPWEAYYPEPETPQEQIEFRCQVLELLDPSKYLGDMFDGIFCKVRKDCYEFNLPIIDLVLPRDPPNFQPIDDFRYWLWNGRS